MARKSGWQQFADNFNSVYGTFNKIGRNIESKKLMDEDYEFYSPDDTEKANPLTGLDRDRAQMRALADIYTKYGDAEGGLKLRTQAAQSEQAERDAEISRQTMAELIKQNGILRSGLMQAQTTQAAGAGANSFANANRTNTLLPTELQYNTLRNTGLQTDNALKGLDLQLGQAVQDSKIDAAISANTAQIAQDDVTRDTAISSLALGDLDFEARQAELLRRVAVANQEGSAADLQNLQNESFLAYANDYQAGKFKTGEEASDAFVSIVGAFDPQRAAKLANQYDSEQIAAIANDGLKIQSEVQRLVQDGDIEGLTAYFDERNGDDIGIIFQPQGDGGFLIQETGKDGQVVNTLLNTATRAEFNEGVQALTTFGNAASYAQTLFDRENQTRQTDISDFNANTQRLSAEATERNVSSNVLRNMKLNDLTDAQIEKVEAEAAALANKGSGVTQKDIEAAFLKMKTSEAYLLAESDQQQSMEDAFWLSFPNVTTSGIKVTKVR
jgi:hypothetical protein